MGINFSIFQTVNDELFICGNTSFGEKESTPEDFKTIVRILEENKLKIIGNNILEGFPKKILFSNLKIQNEVKIISAGFSHVLFHTKNRPLAELSPFCRQLRKRPFCPGKLGHSQKSN